MSTNSEPIKPVEHPIGVVPTGVVTVQMMSRHFKIYAVEEHELDTVASLNFSNSVYVAFLGICVGGLGSFWTAIKTANITDAGTKATFIMLAVMFGVGALLCLLLFISGVVRWRRELDRIKKREIVPPSQ